MHRRRFLEYGGFGLLGLFPAFPCAAQESRKPLRVAAATTVYTHNSHADVILSRLFQTHTLDGKGEKPSLEFAGLYVDQFPENDLSRGFARQFGFLLAPTIREALTLGGAELAVDGILLIGEHGKYPENSKGQTLYPRRRFFAEALEVMTKSRRVAPVFMDKHLAETGKDARWVYDMARRHQVPLMAGSSLPVLWRRPPLDVVPGQRLKEIVAVSYHTLDGYGFHALEMVQCLAERRAGGESGIAAVQCLEGSAVWEAGREGRYDATMLEAALARTESRKRFQGRLQDAVKSPVAFLIEYQDGLKASVLTLNHAVGEWAVAWSDADRLTTHSTLFWTQEARPFAHFGLLMKGIEQMVHTGRPTWPVERTLLTTGALDALLTSKLQGGKRVETPELAIAYKPTYAWTEPPAPPPSRPLEGP